MLSCSGLRRRQQSWQLPMQRTSERNRIFCPGLSIAPVCSADAMGATPEEVERKLPSVERTARPVTTVDLAEVAIRSRHNSGVLQ
jgi:hypothetical protein